MTTRNTSGLRRGGGRTGPNKLTTQAREAFQIAFDEIGGPEALAAWAAENRTEFYKLYGRLIPTEITGAGGDPLAPPVIHVVAPAG